MIRDSTVAIAMAEAQDEILRVKDEMVRIIYSELSSFHRSVELFDEAIAVDELDHVFRRNRS